MNTPNLVTLGHMSRRLGVTSAWLRSEADSGRIPHLLAGERYLFVPDVVIELLANRAAREGQTAASSKCRSRGGKDYNGKNTKGSDKN